MSQLFSTRDQSFILALFEELIRLHLKENIESLNVIGYLPRNEHKLPLLDRLLRSTLTLANTSATNLMLVCIATAKFIPFSRNSMIINIKFMCKCFNPSPPPTTTTTITTGNTKEKVEEELAKIEEYIKTEDYIRLAEFAALQIQKKPETAETGKFILRLFKITNEVFLNELLDHFVRLNLNDHVDACILSAFVR